MQQQTTGGRSSTIQQCVEQSYQLQLTRQHKTNGQLSAKEIDQYCVLNADSKNLLKQAIDCLNLSARSYYRIPKIARKIADLSNKKTLLKHILSRQFSIDAWIWISCII